MGHTPVRNVRTVEWMVVEQAACSLCGYIICHSRAMQAQQNMAKGCSVLDGWVQVYIETAGKGGRRNEH